MTGQYVHLRTDLPCPASDDHSCIGLKYGMPACLGPLLLGTGSRVWPVLGGGAAHAAADLATHRSPSGASRDHGCRHPGHLAGVLPAGPRSYRPRHRLRHGNLGHFGRHLCGGIGHLCGHLGNLHGHVGHLGCHHRLRHYHADHLSRDHVGHAGHLRGHASHLYRGVGHHRRDLGHVSSHLDHLGGHASYLHGHADHHRRHLGHHGGHVGRYASHLHGHAGHHRRDLAHVGSHLDHLGDHASYLHGHADHHRR